MNTKIDSFKTSISEAGTSFAKISSLGNDTNGFKQALAKTQIYIDQANADTAEIKKLSESLKNLQSDSLPMASTDYHTHNIKVLAVVTDYFAAESAIMQGFLTSANTLVAKEENQTLTNFDINIFKQEILAGAANASLSETKFMSDLQTLLGEETTLTLSFWQNDTAIRTSSKVDSAIGAYDNTLKKLQQNTKIVFLDK